MSYEQLDELIEQAAQMEHCPSQVELLEEAVREADRLGDVEAGFEVRMDYIEAATFSGFPEKSLVAFSWCLSQYDEDEESVDEFDLLWKYKWVLNSLPDFPQISKRQILEMQDDMAIRYEKAGYNQRPVHYMRWQNYMAMGDFEQAFDNIEKWKLEPRDWMADCEACEADRHVDLMVELGRHEEAVKIAQPILNEELTCAEIPHCTLAGILNPLVRLGRDAEAVRYHQRGYKLICKNQAFLKETGEHLQYLVRARSLKRGFRLLERHLPWAAEVNELHSRFVFYLSSSLLLSLLSKQEPNKRIRLSVPAQLSCHREDGTYVIADLANWFEQETANLAGQFNQRNGNDYYTRRIELAKQFVGV